MSNSIKIPKHLLRFCPESVPILDVDEMWCVAPGGPRRANYKSLIGWGYDVFGTTTDHYYDVDSYAARSAGLEFDRFLQGLLFDEYRRECDRNGTAAGYDSFDTLTYNSSDPHILVKIWNNVMAQLGYTEVSSDIR